MNKLSLKLVELQVALPRTQDVGKIHEQLITRGQHMQEHIFSEAEKIEKRNRTIVNESNETENAHLHKDQTSKLYPEQRTHKVQNPEQENKEHHPYKGNFIDFLG